jgi:hypothetical protein
MSIEEKSQIITWVDKACKDGGRQRFIHFARFTLCAIIAFSHVRHWVYDNSRLYLCHFGQDLARFLAHSLAAFTYLARHIALRLINT